MPNPSPLLIGKTFLRQKKATWRTVSLENAGNDLNLLPASLRSGAQALYLQSISSDNEHMPWVDVEHSTSHDDIQANIEAAQHAFLCLEELNPELVQGMTIHLTGRAFRFSWPWIIPAELATAWTTFLNDSHVIPNVDPSPNKGGFFRVFGYRGTTTQQLPGSTMDRHIHVLDQADDLLTLTPETYLQLVAGKPDPDDLNPILKRMTPSMDIPSAWVDLLQYYDRTSRLRRNVVTLRPRPKNTGSNMGAVFAYLDAEQVSWTKWAGQKTVYLLDRCPLCGKLHKARVTGSGWLRCHRASCEAHDGIPPWKWVPGYEASPMAEGTRTRETLSIEGARAILADGIRDDAHGDTLLKASAGIGKTHAALDAVLADKAKSGRVLYSVPMNRLGAEILARAEAIRADGVNVAQLQGRNEKTCSRFAHVQAVVNRGLSPSALVCPMCDRREAPNVCPYQGQFIDLPETGLFICAHQKTKTLPFTPDLWVMDESPLDSFLCSSWAGDPSLLAVQHRLPARSADVLQKIRDAAQALHKKLVERKRDNTKAKGIQEARLYGTEPPAGPWEGNADLLAVAGVTDKDRIALDEDLSMFARGKEERFGAWQRRLDLEKLDLTALDWLWSLLGEKAGTAYVQAAESARNPVRYVLHKNETPSFDCRVVALDATGDPAELSALFGREFKVLEAFAHVPARKVHLKKFRGKTMVVGNSKRQGMTDAALKRDLKECFKHLRPHDRKVFLLTFKAVEDRVVELARELEPGREFLFHHFWGSRGLDQFGDCDVCVCLGNPAVNPLGKLDDGMVLFHNALDREKWIAGLGLRDLTQGVNRIRPLYGCKNIVVMGSAWPTDMGDPDLTFDMTRQGSAVDKAVARLLPVMAETSFMFRDLALLCGVATSRDREDLSRAKELVSDGLSLVPSPIYRLSIGDGTDGTPSKTPIILKPHQWSELMDRLAFETSLPRCRVKLAGMRGGRSEAAGYLDDAKRFFESMGIPFDPGSWQGEYRPVAPGLNISRRVLPRPKVMACCAGSVSVLSSSKVKKKTTPPATPKSGVSPMPVKKSPIRPRIQVPYMPCSVDARSLVKEELRRGLAIMPVVPWSVLEWYFEPEPPRLGLAI